MTAELSILEVRRSLRNSVPQRSSRRSVMTTIYWHEAGSRPSGDFGSSCTTAGTGFGAGSPLLGRAKWYATSAARTHPVLTNHGQPPVRRDGGVGGSAGGASPTPPRANDSPGGGVTGGGATAASPAGGVVG